MIVAFEELNTKALVAYDSVRNAPMKSDLSVESPIGSKGKATYMIVRRKFNLSRIGRSYESIDIEVECDTIEEAIARIEDAWKMYCKAIIEGRVQ